MAALLTCSIGCTAPSLPSASGGPLPASAIPTTTAADNTGSASLPTPGAVATSGAPSPSPDTEPSSVDLILEAQMAGRIDRPTALLLRVQAQFGDPRLPDEYRGRSGEDLGAVVLAREAAPDLPADVAQMIQPYIVRPTHPDSVFDPLAIGTGMLAASALGDDTGVLACGTDGWASRSATVPVKVWSPCSGDYEARIDEVVSWAEEVWSLMVGLMGPPVLDLGTPEDGGDPFIDVYLTVDGQCRIPDGRSCDGLDDNGGITVSDEPVTGEPGSAISSGYIILGQDAFGELRSTLVHELFHVFQNAHNQGIGFRGDLEFWFVEASATWAETRFARDLAPAAVYQPLYDFGFSVDDGPLHKSLPRDHMYESFIWPYFMDQERGPQAIAAVWTAIRGKTDWDSANDAIAGRLSFATDFREFAVRNLNTEFAGDPIAPRFSAMDDRFPPGRQELESEEGPTRGMHEIHVQGPGDLPIPFANPIPALTFDWYDFEVDDDVGQVTFDFGQLDPADAYDVDAVLKVAGNEEWERRELASGGETRFCRNKPEDEVEHIILVFSNHEIDMNLTVNGQFTVEALEAPCIGYQVAASISAVWDGLADTLYDVTGTVEGIDTETGELAGTGTLTGSTYGGAFCPGEDDDPELKEVIGGPLVITATFDDLDQVYIGVYPDGLDGGQLAWVFPPVPLQGGTAKTHEVVPRGQGGVWRACGNAGTIDASITLTPLGEESLPHP